MTTFMIGIYCRMLVELNIFKKEERGALNLVEIVVLIGIAVALAVLFRTQIQNLLETLFSSINNNAQEAIN